MSNTAHPKQTGEREEVIFWHFWGGEDRDVVEEIVQQFNDSQFRYRLRAVAMPGNNLQAKLFLAVAGKDPPDIVNQDDPVLADWAKRGVIQPLANIATAAEVDAVTQKLLPAARRLSVVDEQLFAVCNGLDIRALIYNETALKNAGLDFPQTIEQLDAIAEHFSPASNGSKSQRLRAPVGYLPDSRRLWAWGPVFGADFYDVEAQRLQLDSPPVVAALNWMAGYGRRYGADNLAAFRQGDQSLPGKTFPLLPVDDDSVTGRYVVTMDGQWRVRDVVAFGKRRSDLGLPEVKFGVCPLPFVDADGDQQPDPSSRKDAGWVNGNFFVVPRGAKMPDRCVGVCEVLDGAERIQQGRRCGDVVRQGRLDSGYQRSCPIRNLPELYLRESADRDVRSLGQQPQPVSSSRDRRRSDAETRS